VGEDGAALLGESGAIPDGAARTIGCLLKPRVGLRAPAARGVIFLNFGKWNTVFKRYHDWVKVDAFKRLFEAVWPYRMIRTRNSPWMTATLVKIHRLGQLSNPPVRAVGQAGRGFSAAGFLDKRLARALTSALI
jgi:hypothetical protein